MVYLEAFSKVIPIILLFALGALLRRRNFLQAGTVQDLKKLIVNITLPAVLFLAFSSVNLESRHLVVVAGVFVLCLLVMLLGRVLGPAAGVRSAYTPALMSGFEAGMMGYAIFGAVYGSANIFRFAVVDLGQVLFVFFVLVPFVRRLAIGAVPFRQTLSDFFKTPVILSILLGVLANRSGLMAPAQAWPLSAAVLRTLELLAALTTPLIGLIIGYEVSLQRRNLAWPLRTIGLRLLIWMPLGLLLNALVLTRLFPGDRVIQAALMTLFLLPPPFVIPLYMGKAAPKDRAYVVNTLSLATLVTLVAFTLISVFYPA